MRVGKDRPKKRKDTIPAPKPVTASAAKITRRFLKEVKDLGLGVGSGKDFIPELHNSLKGKITVDNLVWASGYCYRFGFIEMGDRLMASAYDYSN